MLYIDRALETAYVTAGLSGDIARNFDHSTRDRLRASDVGAADYALLPTAEISLLTETHRADPAFGVWTSESGAIAMRSPVRPDEIEAASILLYDVSGTAELLARATIWPFYGIKASGWSAEADGSSSITIVDGIAALEPVEAGHSEDLVRAWFILTDQPVVTHLLAIPADTHEDKVTHVRATLSAAFDAGYADRRDVRKALLAGSSAEGDRLVDFLSRLRTVLDDGSRAAAYSLIARGAGGTRYPLIREIPWWSAAIADEPGPE
jgi:hypothetical protein